jgi:hypothetical protein
MEFDMEAKFTKGPWIARPQCESSLRRITITGANSPVAIAEIVPQTMKTYDEVAEANAALIAAAPELYEALEEAAEWIGDDPNDDNNPVLRILLKKIHGALVKARRGTLKEAA